MPAPPRVERCDRCRYWERLEDDLEDIGACHRYPPVIQGERGFNAEFPEVLASDYCGEYSPPDTPEG